MASRVYFDPPLWLQRQSWVLSQLRHEQSNSVVDVGCSNGVLLSALMQPAFQLDEFPVERFPALTLFAGSKDHDGNLLSTKHWIYSANDIVLSRLSGIDIERKALDNAKSSLSLHGTALAKNRPRWTSLDLRLFHGPVETENATLDDYDSFVATEVIEHLHEHALQQFAPTILGKYRPRQLLITTPNYSFNANFGADLTTRPGFIDPTGRTNRVFRHDDHKFEFTPAEFKKWCDNVADDFGYEVQIHGIGVGIHRSSRDNAESPSVTSGLSRTTASSDEDLRFASQGAIFTRISASSRATYKRHASNAGLASDSSHPFSDQYVKNSLPRAPVDTELHDIFDEAVRRKTDAPYEEDDEDQRGRGGRRARSRRPENLPFLSSPSIQLPQAASPQRSAAQTTLEAGTALETSAPSTPFTGHQLIWSQRYTCPLDQNQVQESGNRKVQSAVPLSVEEIRTAVIERHRELYVDAQWDEDYVAPADGSIGKQAVTQLWNIWSDDECRGACGGRITTLFDALRLVATEPSPDFANDSNQTYSGLPIAESSTHKSVVVGTDGGCWELRVQTTRHSNQAASSTFVDSDLYLVYTHPEIAQWQESIDEAKRWVPKQFASSRKASAHKSSTAPYPVTQSEDTGRAPSWD